jgi:hypothetical protein
MKSRRVRPPKATQHQVREECGQACANPSCRELSSASHEVHHIDGNTADSSRENLILLCGTCHNKEIAGVISMADVLLWKRMAQAGALPPPKGVQATSIVSIQDNSGIAGHVVNINTVKLQSRSGPRTRREITPGLIEADPDMRTYATYLVGRYIKWRKNGKSVDSRLFNPGSAHGILGEGFGSPSSVLLIPQTRFFAWVAQAQAKIDNTVFGQSNKRKVGRNFHSWEEHLAERRGEVI